MSPALTAILIGAGNRGYEAYGAYALAHPDEMRFVAVAEPHPARRERFARAHAIPADAQFSTWEELLSKGQMAGAALVCTLDRLHVEPAVAALQAGYDVLLEKPMATTLPDCLRLVQTAERTRRLLQICHVLRYSPFFSALHDILQSGRLGQVITVEHRENVAYWHMAHSYVRGNSRNSTVESPMILSKCCHDLDVLVWNLGPCRRLSSFGALTHYREENAPAGAPERCTDGCPAAASCPWYAPRLYLHIVPLLHVAHSSPLLWERWAARLILDWPWLASLARRTIPGLQAALDYRGWPVSVISEDMDAQARQRALETGPYGRCIYRCDNNVVDHEVVSMEMTSGATVTLTMHGHSHREGRTMRYDGTRATLFATYYPNDHEIQIHDHHSGRVSTLRFPIGVAGAAGHAGADHKLMAGFVRAVRDPACALTTARESLQSHLLAFAAEEARLQGVVVDMEEFGRRAEAEGLPESAN